MTYNNAHHIRIANSERSIDIQRYRLHSSSLACGFLPALIHRRRGKSTRIHGVCLTPAIHPDADFAGMRGCETARRDRSRTRITNTHRQMRRASNCSFYATGYVLGRRSISHVAHDDKTLRAKWPVHLGPAKPAIHSAEQSRAARHTREKDAKLEH